VTEQIDAGRLASATAAWVKPLRITHAWLPAAPLLVALLAFARAVTVPRSLLNDPDTYLHIAVGRWIVSHGALPFADPFSFSLPGAPWVPGEWLGEVVLFLAYRLAGWNGVVLLTAGCYALAAGLLGHFAVRRLGGLPGIVFAVAGAALVLPHLLARPHVLTLPLLAGWCGILLRARDEGTGPSWLALPLVVIWANLHPSFLFGLALAGFLAGEAVLLPGPSRPRFAELRAWGGFALAAAGLAVLTPNGFAGIVQPLGLMAMPALRASFGEWRPANLAEFPALEFWVLFLSVAGFTLRPRLRWTRLALLLALLHMTLMHVRHADLLGLVGPLVIAAGFAPVLGSRVAGSSGWLGERGIFSGPVRWQGAAVALLLAVAAAVPLLARPLVRADDPVTPGAAVAAAQRLGLQGPVFNAECFGGYLVFSGIPDFIDGRIEMYGNSFLATDVAAEGGDAAALARLLKRFRIGWTLLPPDAAGIAVLDGLPGWRRAYADGVAVIHVRSDSVTD
jgi:hypothetical protein